MKKILTLAKSKLFTLSCALGLTSVALAEGEGAASPITTIGASVATELQSWTDGITNFFTTNIGSIMAVLGVAVAISLVWMVFKIFRKGSNKVG